MTSRRKTKKTTDEAAEKDTKKSGGEEESVSPGMSRSSRRRTRAATPPDPSKTPDSPPRKTRRGGASSNTPQKSTPQKTTPQKTSTRGRGRGTPAKKESPASPSSRGRGRTGRRGSTDSNASSIGTASVSSSTTTSTRRGRKDSNSSEASAASETQRSLPSPRPNRNSKRRKSKSPTFLAKKANGASPPASPRATPKRKRTQSGTPPAANGRSTRRARRGDTVDGPPLDDQDGGTEDPEGLEDSVGSPASTIGSIKPGDDVGHSNTPSVISEEPTAENLENCLNENNEGSECSGKDELDQVPNCHETAKEDGQNDEHIKEVPDPKVAQSTTSDEHMKKEPSDIKVAENTTSDELIKKEPLPEVAQSTTSDEHIKKEPDPKVAQSTTSDEHIKKEPSDIKVAENTPSDEHMKKEPSDIKVARSTTSDELIKKELDPKVAENTTSDEHIKKEPLPKVAPSTTSDEHMKKEPSDIKVAQITTSDESRGKVDTGGTKRRLSNGNGVSESSPTSPKEKSPSAKKHKVDLDSYDSVKSKGAAQTHTTDSPTQSTAIKESTDVKVSKTSTEDVKESKTSETQDTHSQASKTHTSSLAKSSDKSQVQVQDRLTSPSGTVKMEDVTMDTLTLADTFLEGLGLNKEQTTEVSGLVAEDVRDSSVAAVVETVVEQLLVGSATLTSMNAPRFNKFLHQLLSHYCSLPTNEERKRSLCERAVEWARAKKTVHLRHELELTLMALYYTTKQYKKAETIANALYSETKKLQDKDKTVKACLCLSKVYHAMGNISKARANITTAKTEALKIYTPPDMQGELDLQSGIMQVAEGKDLETAYSYFKEAACGFLSKKQRSRSLKYMLLSKVMVNRAEEGAKAVQGQSHIQDIDEGVEAMLAITAAANKSSLADFKKTREQYAQHLEGDMVVASVLNDLYNNMMEKNLSNIVLPYERLQIVHIAEKIGLPREDVEKRLSQMILDKRINAQLDHRDNCLYVYGPENTDQVYQTGLETVCQLDKTISHLNTKVKKLL